MNYSIDYHERPDAYDEVAQRGLPCKDVDGIVRQQKGDKEGEEGSRNIFQSSSYTMPEDDSQSWEDKLPHSNSVEEEDNEVEKNQGGLDKGSMSLHTLEVVGNYGERNRMHQIGRAQN